MLNIDRASILTNTKASESKSVNANQALKPITPITAEQDTVTLSKQAIALINGNKGSTTETVPTYIKPETSSSLYIRSESSTEATNADSKTDTNNLNNINNSESAKAIRFDEIMQSILANRTGIDKDKLAEIDIMIEEIGKNKQLSSEQKEKQIEVLYQMKEDMISGGNELKKVTEQTGESAATTDGMAE